MLSSRVVPIVKTYPWPLILLLLLQPAIADSWKEAVGELSSVDKRQRVWFEDPSSFETLSSPWGKSVSHYLSHWYNAPKEKRSVMEVRWLDKEDPPIELNLLGDYLGAFFQLPVRIRREKRFDWPDPEDGKYSAETLQEYLLGEVEDDTFAIIGLTNRSIFSEDNGPAHLLFGQGHYYNRTAVASFHELDTEDEQLLHHRIFKLVSHELVHTFSIEHCGYFRCLLNPSGSMLGSDRRPLFCCPICLRKLHSVLGFEPEKRYQNLLKTVRPALQKDGEWLARRLGQKRR